MKLSRSRGALHFLTVLVLTALVTGAYAGPIRKGAVMEVKPNSIWFEEVAQAHAVAGIEKGRRRGGADLLSGTDARRREAWQFLKPLKVKILRYDTAASQINVEMKTSGRCKAPLGGSTRRQWGSNRDAVFCFQPCKRRRGQRYVG